jgi:SIR2-like domain
MPSVCCHSTETTADELLPASETRVAEPAGGNGRSGLRTVAAMTVDLADHYRKVVRGLRNGWIVPVLGAGANRAGRPADAHWAFGAPYLPDGAELATYLAEEFDEYEGDPRDLIRISQYVAVMGGGTGPLYQTLHPVFDRDYAITPLHDFLARLPGLLRDAGRLRSYPLVLTTNYDDLLERAFDAVGEPYDLCAYVAEGSEADKGRFCHRLPGGELCTIAEPEAYLDLSLDNRTIVLKIHGFVDRARTSAGPKDSYVITEDHYIEYLTRTDLRQLLPPNILARLAECHFLFVGYSLRDWNLRAILHRLSWERTTRWESWSVQLKPDPLERKSWELRDVHILELDVNTYLAGLKEHLLASLAKAAPAP